MDGWNVDVCFQDRMDAGRDHASFGPRVTYQRVRMLTVDDVAVQLGVSAVMVRKLIARGGIKARRVKAKGRPWAIPARLVDGQYLVEVTAGKRGPLPRKAKLLSSAGRVPF